MIDEFAADDLAKAVERGEYRLLKRVVVEESPCSAADDESTSIAAVVDVETSGLDPTSDRITELAIRRFRFDRQGRIVKVDRPYAWFEDPGRPLPDDIVRLTGITNEMLSGERIDEEQATTLLQSASVVISHNAAFDRPFVDERLEDARGLPWACSCDGIDWKTFGFNGRALGWLLAQCGWYHEAHRALADVDALITLLREEICPGSTVLEEMLVKARQPSWIVRAIGAHFDVKDRLKARGYRWDAGAAVWFKEVGEDDLQAEEEWLLVWVYAPGCRARVAGPFYEKVTWRTRYAAPQTARPLRACV